MAEKKIYSAEINHVVPFFDLDPMQIVWHGNYLKYFDMARFALFNQAGIDLYDFYLKTQYLFPVVKTETKYIESLRYGDQFVCKASVMESQIKIVIGFEIRRNGRIYARGRSDQVAVKMPENEMLFQIPAEIRKAFGMI